MSAKKEPIVGEVEAKTIEKKQQTPEQRIAELEAKVKSFEQQATDANQDVIAGHAQNGKKHDGTIAKFTELFIYELGPDKRPIVVGEYTNQQGDKLPKYKLATVLRIADSSLLKVKNQEAKRCNIYWSPKY